MRPNKRNASLIVAVSLLSAMSTVCFAALGGDLTSIQADQTRMRARREVTQAARYSMHEMRTESGIRVREFVSPAGKVFGVSWQGPTRPDMQQLLGSYYDEYTRSLPVRRVHGPVTIQTGNAILQSGGHQQALFGRAYVPDLVPDGVRLEEIQ